MFFGDSDAKFYLRLLHRYAARHHVQLLAYCLMPNHVHLVAVPPTGDALSNMCRTLHMRYAQHINSRRGWKGHLWQERFFSAAMDEHHLWAAIRYVERNPVRAGLVQMAANYGWSSAPAHCGLRTDAVLTKDGSWRERLQGITDWRSWLAEGEDESMLARLRSSVRRGVPCGTPEFVARLERTSGRKLHDRQPGRPARVRRGDR